MRFSEMFHGCEFVSPDEYCTSPYMRCEFSSPEFDSAVLTVCGLGFFVAKINGSAVSDDWFQPVTTQFERRMAEKLNPEKHFEEMSWRIYCPEYDVTRLIKNGKNALGFQLGNGWYNQKSDSRGSTDKSEIKLCFKLVFKKNGEETGRYGSGSDIRWKQSEITENDIYTGERVDFSCIDTAYSFPGAAEDGYSPVNIVPAPDTDYYVQDCPADKIERELEPGLINTIGQTRIFDCNEAVTGHALLTATKDGAEFTVQYAESLNPDGTLDFEPTGGMNKLQQDIFKNAEKGTEAYPKFCFHAFRYISVTGDAEIKSVRVIHSDCAVTSDFSCDNETLNWLYTTYIRTQLDNMHCGVPSDCPHIERLGYTGDGQLCAPAVMLMTDSKHFYKKWMRDIADSQDINTGHVQHTAPFMGGGGGPAAWGGAIVTVPYYYWKAYGDKSALEEYLPNMLKYVSFMESVSENSLIWKEIEGEWCLGDWCAPTEINKPSLHYKSRLRIPEAYVNTALFVKQLMMITEMAEAIGKSDAVSGLNELIEAHKRAVKIAYYSPMYHDFCGNVQGANAFALDIGLADEKTLFETVKYYRGRGYLDTGIVATELLIRLLFNNGYATDAFNLLTSEGDISFYYMMTHGATTLWEDWHPERSLNHPMFGAVTHCLFTCLLGISQEKASAGYEKILIAPKMAEGLNRAKGHVITVKGKIGVEYEKSENKAIFTVTLPYGTSATFKIGEKTMLLTEEKQVFSVELD